MFRDLSNLKTDRKFFVFVLVSNSKTELKSKVFFAYSISYDNVDDNYNRDMILMIKLIIIIIIILMIIIILQT